VAGEILMFSPWFIVAAAAAYLGLLFVIASYGDRRAHEGRQLIDNPLVYTLSMAVYCTSWTFYGSVGLASEAGIAFLPTYLGPTLAALLFPFVLHKILRIAKTYSITSVADFLAARYGKSTALGGIATAVAMIAGIPYIALQLKALSASANVMLGLGDGEGILPFGIDSGFVIAIVMAVFAILFGTRHIDATETHQGMVLAIAFESIVKLTTFIAVGIFVTFFLYDGFDSIIQATRAAGHGDLLLMPEGWNYFDWFLMILLAGSVVFVLPRQFQVAVIENVDERHIRTATWAFPTYLLLINIFVIPIALAGRLGGIENGDLIVLFLPLEAAAPWLALVVFIGGLSAATAMIIVSTVALSTMISNDVVMPVLLRVEALQLTRRRHLSRLVITIRRASILLLLVLAYIFFQAVGAGYGLVGIGLIAFAAVAQLVPALVLGIFWRDANLVGALAGLTAGIAVWGVTLIVPALAKTGVIDPAILVDGFLGSPLLRPEALFGLDGLQPVSHALFWSITVNLLLLVGGSLLFQQDNLQRLQALLFVNIFEREGTTRIWRGDTRVAELHELLLRFIGREQAEHVLATDAYRRGHRLAMEERADAEFVQLVERHVARAIGAASARAMVASVVRGEVIGPDDILEILDEASQVIEYSHQLEERSRALEQAGAELKQINERLRQLDRMKDDFLATVSHELRTPLTSIRSFSEILIDNPDLELEERKEFLGIVVRESERLTRLINNVLDLSKIESGSMDWHVRDVDLVAVIDEAMAATRGLASELGATLERGAVPDQPALVRGDHDRLVQVAVNLLGNAFKFVPAKGGIARIGVTRDGADWVVGVEDNGPGVSLQYRDAIFEKFHQASESLKDRPKGTGLGLTICQQIVSHFGGRIWVEDAPLGGACFRFRLPALPAAQTRAAAE
jgi:Na+/proline symporter/nitrogen-specific signal transduction histidine kinase